MNPDRPNRQRDSNASAGDSVLVVIDAVLLPPEQSPNGGVRYGRPSGPPPEVLLRQVPPTDPTAGQ